jgi:predicted GIY-YIG superfamily endonuclease
MLMFPDARPLVERLGLEFFRQLPETSGVYLMRDAAGTVLYVGKAKNLRRRLNSYRVANPDRLPRRHLRLLGTVARIEWQSCSDEAAAVARESELLLALKPRFNRAGTWRGPDRFLIWRRAVEHIEFGVAAIPESGWQAVGPMGSSAFTLQAVLVRLFWFTLHPVEALAMLPVGWAHGRCPNPVTLSSGAQGLEMAAWLEGLFAGKIESFCERVRSLIPETVRPFERAALEADLEWLRDFRPMRRK